MKHKVALGIDIGKEVTTLSIKKEETPMYCDKKIKVPSVYIITKLGELLFGQTAINYAKINNEMVAEIPQIIEESLTFVNAEYSYSVDKFWGKYFIYLKSLVAKNGQDICSVVLSCFYEGMKAQQLLFRATEKMKVPVYFIAKSVSCTLPVINLAEEQNQHILCCVIGDEQIEGCITCGGDGVVEVLALEQKCIQKCQDSIKVTIENLVDYLFSRVSGYNEVLEKIDVVQI